MPCDLPQRVVVVGSSGAGKSTFARRAAALLGCPAVEMDALHWGPDWVEEPREVLARRVLAATAGEAWVVDGNYASVRALTWPRAEAIVWLDLSFPRVFWRILTRTLRRVLRRERLWAGNRETLARTFLSRESMLWWTLTTFGPRRREYTALLSQPELAYLRVHRLRTPAEVEALLAGWGDARNAEMTSQHGGSVDAV